MRYYLTSGRFWAEEGTIFYRKIADLGLLESAFLLFNGHLELITNLVVLASTWVDLRFAPLVTTYLSFLLQSLPIVLLLCFRRSLHLGRLAVFGLVIVVAGMPQAQEVWANSINLHFHFSLLLALVIAIPIVDQSRHVWLFRVLVFCCGLSGIPAHFLAPVLLYRAYRERERERWFQFGILGACTLLQLVLIGIHGNGDRVLVFDPLVYMLVALYQHGCTLLFGYPGREASVEFIQQALAGQWWALAGAVTGLAVMTLFVIRSAAESPVKRVLLLSVLFLSYASFVTALGDDRTQIIHRFFGGRYFFASNVLLLLVLFGGEGVRRNRVISVCAVIVAVVALKGVNGSFKGPDWRDAYTEATQGNKNEIEVWPGGWYLKIPESANLRIAPVKNSAAVE